MKNLVDLNDKGFFSNTSSLECSKDYYDEVNVVDLLSEVEMNSKDIKMDLLDNDEKVVNINFGKKDN